MQIQTVFNSLDFTVILLYFLALIAIGIWSSVGKRHTDDLFLGGRNLRWYNIGLTIFGANVSPSMMIGACSIAYAGGMVGSNFEWLAFIFLFLLSMLFLPYYLTTKISTMPEFLSRRFSNSCREFLSWYALFSTLWMWIGGALFIGAVVMWQVTAWPYWLCVLILAFVSILLTVMGGLETIAITDTFQSALIIVVSAALTLIGLHKVGGVEKLVSSVPADFWTLFRSMNDEKYPWLAIVLGYPVMGIWFWCTDQTIVQKTLGGKDLNQSQLGCIFAAAIKIIMPFIFFLPGIICRVLHPDLDSSDKAYVTMVSNYMPHGMIGLIIAVIVAALVSTVDAGLNAFSTIFTLDIYIKKFNPNASAKKVKSVGRIVTILIGCVAIACALLLHQIKDMDLFSLGQSLISFLAPTMAAVFLIGVIWKRATSQAAMATLIFGNIICIVMGVLYLGPWIDRKIWPHFLMLSFYLFVVMCLIMVVVSLLTPKPSSEYTLPSFKEMYGKIGKPSKLVWSLWILIAVIMVLLYVIFN